MTIQEQITENSKTVETYQYNSKYYKITPKNIAANLIIVRLLDSYDIFYHYLPNYILVGKTDIDTI